MKKGYTFNFCILQCCYWISVCLVYAFAERFLSAYGLTKTQIGLTMALANVAALLLQPVIAGAVDRKNAFTLRVALSGGAALVVLIAIFELNPSNPTAITAILFGVVSTVTLTLQPLANAVGFYYVNQHKKLDFTVGRGVASGAYALAALAYGYLFDTFGAPHVLWLYMAGNIGLFVMALTFAPHREGALQSRESSGGMISVLRKKPWFALFLLGNILLFIPHNFTCNYLYSISQATGARMEVASAIMAASEIPIMILLSQIMKRISVNKLLCASSALFILKIIVLTLPVLFPIGGWLIYAGEALQMFSYAIFVPVSAFFANDCMDDADKVKGQMLLTETTIAAGVVSMLLGGIAIDTLGIPISMLICLGLFAAASGVIIFSVIQNQKRIDKDNRAQASV